MMQKILKISLSIFVLLLVIKEGNSESTQSSAPGKTSFWGSKFFGILRKKQNNSSETDSSGETKGKMGQAVRIMKYDRAENERNAIPALTMDLMNQEAAQLKWHRLDDGVMGGQSESLHVCSKDGSLHFKGQINTSGGGFCSIRSPLPQGLPENTTAIRLRFKGDGKTYKFLLSDGNRSTFGPSRRSPSWQCDIPTKNSGEIDEITIPFSSLKPSFGPRPVSSDTAKFEASSMGEIGVMLSLQLSDGSSNPVETFGTGIFPFSFEIFSIHPIVADQKEL